MRIPYFQGQELLAFELGLDGGCGRLDSGSVTYTDETQDRSVAFANAEDVVVEVGACCSWRVLVRICSAFNVQNSFLKGVQVQLTNIPHISLCFLTSLSSTLTYAFLAPSSCSTITNGGIDRLSLPNGPSISIVDVGATAALRLFFLTGGIMLKLTSGGIDSGARPICDARFGVDEN